MADTDLGYGNRNSASIDHVNQMMRTQPWYQAKLAQLGVDPNNVHLSPAQQEEILRTAQANGIVVDEGHDGQEIDESGNFRAKGHKLRNTMIALGVAGAALATMGAAGVFAGAGGAGAAGASAAPAAAGLGGVEGSAVAGLGAASLPGAGTALGTGSSLAALGSTAAPLAGTLPGGAATSGFSTAGAGMTAGGYTVDAAGNVIDAAGVPAETGSRLADLANGLGKLGNAASTIANNGQDPDLAGIGAANAASQAARNRILGAQVDLGGPAADKTALSNMRTAGLMTSFKDAPANEYGSPAISLNPATRTMAQQFQDELLKRQAAGKSLTASGVPDPTAQELADEAKARDIANGGSGIAGKMGQIINGVNTGARLARLAPGVISGVKDIWSMF